MNRRRILAGLALAGLEQSLLAPALSRGAAAQATATPFDDTTVRTLARERAGKPYEAPDERLPGPLAELGYDAYRGLRFNPDRALWRGNNLPFQMQPFHRGFLFKQRVDLFEVAEGRAAPIPYDPRPSPCPTWATPRRATSASPASA